MYWDNMMRPKKQRTWAFIHIFALLNRTRIQLFKSMESLY